MPKSQNQKSRLLLLERLFLQETDEQHPLSLSEIQRHLMRNGIEAERRTLYDDFECLTQMGIEILRTGNAKYYTESRLFETAELKLLTDAVAAARFLSEKKSDQLIRKLTSLADRSSHVELNRQLHVAGKVKTVNERVHYSVDELHRAIREDRQVMFQYFDWSVGKEKVYRRNGEPYTVSPWTLLWEEERYYLLAYDAQAGGIRHYRVDKMEHLHSTDLPREGSEQYAAVRPEQYSSRVFGMFGGQEETVTLCVDNALAGVMVDRFGLDTAFLHDGPDRFRFSVRVVPSGNFYGWVFSFGGRVKILAPEPVCLQFDAYLHAFWREKER